MVAGIMRFVVPILLLLGVRANAQDILQFMGRAVTIIKPELGLEGRFPKNPATICVAGLPKPQRYTMPKEYGRDPQVRVIQLKTDLHALFFSAETGGVEGNYGFHRYRISAYVRLAFQPHDDSYYLEDQYMTVGRYDSTSNLDILAAEKQEIRSRLRRVQAARQSDPWRRH